MMDNYNEFYNIIDEVLTTFNINRSLSKKGCPYDNAVAVLIPIKEIKKLLSK